MTTAVEKVQDWRTRLERYIANGVRLEALVDKLGLPGNGWRVEPALQELVLEVDGATLAEYREAVSRVADAIGPPDAVKPAATRSLWLDAQWHLDDGVTVRVSNWRPKGCRLIERVKEVIVTPPSATETRTEIMEQVLHPECAAVLKELEG